MNLLAPVFSQLVGFRNWLYEKEFIKTIRLKVPVVSVGNITMGGTGKTPMIHWLIGELNKLNYQPGIVSRNYRATNKTAEWVVLRPRAFAAFGDEAVLLKVKNPEVPIISGPQKWLSAQKMVEESPQTNLVLVDDGFQHRKLHRDFDIVLIDVSVDRSDYHWPPEGRARESLDALARADVIVLTRWEQRNQETVSFLEPWTSQSGLVLRAEQSADEPMSFAGRPIEDGMILKNGRGLAFCGLGNPESFRKTLKAKGLTIGKFISYPDHADYDQERINELLVLAEDYDYLLTSEKDMVKLQEWPFQGPPLYVIPMQLKLDGDLEAFREKLAGKIRKSAQ
ncbi:MAG: tetraacyldisaccharide 4-kinase [Pseudomonadota bacterium]|jgi:tetraacyldisaccharide 4'-kinase